MAKIVPEESHSLRIKMVSPLGGAVFYFEIWGMIIHGEWVDHEGSQPEGHSPEIPLPLFGLTGLANHL